MNTTYQHTATATPACYVTTKATTHGRSSMAQWTDAMPYHKEHKKGLKRGHRRHLLGCRYLFFLVPYYSLFILFYFLRYFFILGKSIMSPPQPQKKAQETSSIKPLVIIIRLRAQTTVHCHLGPSIRVFQS